MSQRYSRLRQESAAGGGRTATVSAARRARLRAGRGVGARRGSRESLLGAGHWSEHVLDLLDGRVPALVRGLALLLDLEDADVRDGGARSAGPSGRGSAPGWSSPSRRRSADRRVEKYAVRARPAASGSGTPPGSTGSSPAWRRPSPAARGRSARSRARWPPSGACPPSGTTEEGAAPVGRGWAPPRRPTCPCRRHRTSPGCSRSSRRGRPPSRSCRWRSAWSQRVVELLQLRRHVAGRHGPSRRPRPASRPWTCPR